MDCKVICGFDYSLTKIIHYLVLFVRVQRNCHSNAWVWNFSERGFGKDDINMQNGRNKSSFFTYYIPV